MSPYELTDEQLKKQLRNQNFMTAGTSLAGGIFDIIAANKALEKSRADLDAATDLAGKTRKQIGDFSFEADQALRNLKTLGIQEPDTSGADATLATILENSGPNLDYSKLYGATVDQKLKQEQDALDREVKAETEYANMMNQFNLMNQQKNFGLMQDDLSLARADIQNAKLAEEMANQQKAAGQAALAGSLLNIGTSFIPFAEGGAVEQLLRRGNVVKTEGEFDHDTNKKALVDEQSGKKEAELTGGEYVLNPEQGEEIHAQYEAIEAKIQKGEPISEEEWMMYHEAVKNVFSQPQFNEEEFA